MDILEPSAGQGVFINAIKNKHPDSQITGVEIDPNATTPEGADEWISGDFLKQKISKRYDLAIGNPPYGLALEFVQKCLLHSDNTIMLLRLGFLASIKRSEFYRQNPPSHVHVLPNRPSFTGASTDKYEYCFMSWGTATRTELHWLPTVPPKHRR